MSVSPAVRDSSSFRDFEGYVFFEDGKVKRKISSKDAIERMTALLQHSVFKDDLKDDVVASILHGDTMEHERIEIVTYPYEWSFLMLLDAAIAQLRIMQKLVSAGFILKDGCAFNSMYHNGRMVFIDVLSIEFLKNQPIWNGYHQFCEHFLYPLMLKAYKNINFQDWWRGTMNGIATADLNRVLSRYDWLKSGVFLHAVLKNKFAGSIKKEDGIDKTAVQKVPASTILNLANGLSAVIGKMASFKSDSMWTDYEGDNSYTPDERVAKHEFVEEFCKSSRAERIVDLGCNAGEYSKIAADYAKRVISVDYDPDCIDRLYARIKKGEMPSNIVPVVSNLVNSSPSQGWNLCERSGLFARVKADAFIAVALMHHLCISCNIPIAHLVTFLKGVAPSGIIEWVDIDDPMVQVLLKNRKNIFEEYTWENFKAEIEKHFKIEKIFEFPNAKRKLCSLSPL